jgi:serine O-acetyltransferase
MSYLRSDLKRYFRNKRGLARIKMVLLTQGIWATIVFRMGSWCHRRKGKLVWPSLILPFLTVLQKVVELVTGISIPFTANIGRGLYIGHFGGIILSPDTVLGEYCNLSQGVTIGQAGRGGKQQTPVIGDRAYIGPGAKIFGGIRIGNDVAIGANAVVTKDLPDKAVAVGVPAQIISYGGSGDFVIFEGEEESM